MLFNLEFFQEKMLWIYQVYYYGRLKEVEGIVGYLFKGIVFIENYGFKLQIEI